MRIFPEKLPPLVLAAALLAAIPVSGCQRTTYIDEAHHDSHTWDSHEASLYAQWERETQRAHVDFERRNAADQREYWDWRHRH
jgi:outer membrane murein-binding lipoprotein Lpp